MPKKVQKHCNLEHEILSAGMTREEFAGKANISISYLCQIITMRRRPGKQMDKKIREALGCWDDDLYMVDPYWIEHKQDKARKLMLHWKRVLTDNETSYGKGGEDDEERAC